MATSGHVEIRRLDGEDLVASAGRARRCARRLRRGGRFGELHGAFSHEDARLRGMGRRGRRNRRLILAAFLDGGIIGTVQVSTRFRRNQPHRVDIAKLLVHRSARRGIAQLLMDAAEREARPRGRHCSCWTPSRATMPSGCTSVSAGRVSA